MDREHGDLVEETIDSRQVFGGRLLDVRCDRVRLPDGTDCCREYIRHQGAVVIIAELGDGKLLFVRQHRYPLRRSFLELPAGKIDRGESVLETAMRELLEETGCRGEEWRHVGTMHPCVGYSDEKIEIFLAKGVHPVQLPNLDEGEFLEVLSLPLSDALSGIKDGLVTDGKTIAGLFWAEKLLRGGW